MGFTAFRQYIGKHRRLFILLFAVVSFIISMPFLRAGWFLDDTFFRSQVHKGTVLNARIPDSLSYKHWKGFYIFFDKNERNQSFLKDQGIAPWWMSAGTQVAFWRPLSSLTLFLDFTLWPGHPVLIHLHSIIWFMLLAAAAALLYRKMFADNLLFLLAALLFLVNRINCFTVAFISNRHALIAILFNFITLSCYMKGTGKSRCLSWFLFLLSLFCSEVGLINIAYLFAYTLFLDQRPFPEKAKSLVPFIVIILLWRTTYNLLGFGAYGSELYVDPVNSPLRFAGAVFKRFPLLLFSLFLGLPADFINCLSGQAMTLLAVLIYCISGIGMYYLVKRKKADPRFLFWLTAACLSVIPLCIPIPADRNLMFASFGAAGCMAQAAGAFLSGEKRIPQRKTKRLLPRCLAGCLLGINLLEGIVGIFLVPAGMTAIHKEMQTLYDFGNDPAITAKDLVIVTAPHVHYFYSYWIERDLEHLPIPRTMQLLAPGLAPVALTRVDSRSLLVKPETGFYPPPAGNPRQPFSAHFSMLNFYRLLERSFIDLKQPVAPGHTFLLSRMKITVTKITTDRRIAEALFTFYEDLEDAALQWITWNPGKAGYEPFRLPGAGETVIIN